jgi:putative colanic acid biosynthesis UDP-glucose lipid carrier transferase
MIPFWLLIYPIVGLIIKVTSPGPVFFKQKRNGLNGRIFYCYKFRSMKVNAAADQQQATANDPRKTRFGDFLRRSSIDELPQFINVLRGEMSIVGPRPHMVKHTEEYSAIIDRYMVRHWVKPGITGWAQVNGARGETQRREQMEDRIDKDVWYIENWTFGLDLRIIFLTIYNGLRGDKQAY